MYVCMYTVYMPGALGSQTKVPGPLELELHMVMNCHDVEN